ncbi:DUF7282 domain-containing protein [Halorussus lipolyticus]|uniref:DUF7282 domain-containing protein n=1 Tax=Halorussus lipolyticus TaxID=3034024 RepID=UPI0023E873D7|nr:PGF-CTERM sorting domain-containing protein [Halorussus sp. DT80]
MTGTTRTVLVAALLALAVFTGVALASPATSTTADVQANETTTANDTATNETTTANDTATNETTTATETTNETAANETASNETTPNETASVSAPDQQFDGESLSVDSATLPDGGFVVVYNQSGAVLGHTDYLDAGNHTNLTVSLNATLEDPQVLVLGVYRNNGSQTFNASQDSVSYMTANDKEVSDVAYVYFQKRGAETTADESTDRSTEMETETTTESAMSDETEETTTESSGGIPGFTPSTAVVALVAAALIGWRRS